MFKSIRSILYFSFLIVGISLFLIIILGLRQYQLSSRYNEISMLSERALFSFATIREQATESLIVRNYDQLGEVIDAIEQVNNIVLRLYDSDVIPGQYKLTMADRIDLAGLVISLRKIDSAADKAATGIKLQQDLRQIADSLMKIDRIITGQIRDAVVNFQLSVIGALGVLLSGASFILIALYRKAVKPLLELSSQALHDGIEKSGFHCPVEAGAEIGRFVNAANEIMLRLPAVAQQRSASGTPDADLLPTTINESANSLNAIINYAQLLLESKNTSQLAGEDRKMLEHILESSERIAGQWRSISERFCG